MLSWLVPLAGVATFFSPKIKFDFSSLDNLGNSLVLAASKLSNTDININGRFPDALSAAKELRVAALALSKASVSANLDVQVQGVQQAISMVDRVWNSISEESKRTNETFRTLGINLEQTARTLQHTSVTLHTPGINAITEALSTQSDRWQLLANRVVDLMTWISLGCAIFGFSLLIVLALYLL
jgi:hypothetical protein